MHNSCTGLVHVGGQAETKCLRQASFPPVSDSGVTGSVGGRAQPLGRQKEQSLTSPYPLVWAYLRADSIPLMGPCHRLLGLRDPNSPSPWLQKRQSAR